MRKDYYFTGVGTAFATGLTAGVALRNVARYGNFENLETKVMTVPAITCAGVTLYCASQSDAKFRGQTKIVLPYAIAYFVGTGLGFLFG